MPLRNAAARYGSVAMSLHWLIALAVVLNVCLGLYMSDLPRSDPNQFAIVQFHKSVGLSVLALSVARLLWRLVNPIPPLPDTMSPFLRFVARATHVLLYVLIIFIPLSGWAMVSSSPLGLPTMYFGLFQWPHLSFLSDLPRAQKIPLQHEFRFIHTYLAWSAIALVPLHVVGALYHQFVRGDDILKRMLPGRRASRLA